MSSRKQNILIVDDVPENIRILLETLRDEYSVMTATNGEKALQLAAGDKRPDIILLDIQMPGMDGYEVCRILKEQDSTEHIPIIFITAMTKTEDEEKGLDLGAVDYITKPFNPGLVRKRVYNQLELKMYQDRLENLVLQRTKEINETRLEIIRKLGRAAEYKDNETGNHVIRMSNYCKIIALAYGLKKNEADLILNAAPMHDIGKIGIPDVILQKPGRLDEDERRIMNRHSFMGYKIIGNHKSDIIQSAAIVAYQHHEKWDGSGYPRKLKGEEIHLYGRIVALADVFDALTSKRPYKEAWSIEKAMELIKNERGKHFQPELVDTMFDTFRDIIEVREEMGE